MDRRLTIRDLQEMKRRGEKIAALTAYAALIDQWKQADANLLELREARDFLKQAKR